MSINIQIEKKGDWEHVGFIGPINEDAEVHFAPLVKQLSANVIFNFKLVEYVNSCGVRAWINFIRDVEKGRKVIFEECTPEIVSQINMIPNFRGNSRIKSVYASYSCESCDHQQWMLFEEGRNLPQDLSASVPPVACEKCAKTMEMEELEDEFFAWLEAS